MLAAVAGGVRADPRVLASVACRASRRLKLEISPITAIARDAYAMRMARVNITVPDEVLGRAKAAGLNVSRLAAAALAEELDRRTKIAELDRYLSELDVELGPISADDEAAARQWADDALGAAGTSSSRRPPRSA